MITSESLQFELRGRFDDLADTVGKHYLSVRWEEAPRIVRVGACLTNYTVEARQKSLEALIDFERAHREDFAVEFDIVPFDPVHDEEYAEA